MNLTLLALLFTITNLPYFTEEANIFVYLPSIGRSHFKPFEPLFFTLAQRGHNVTVMSRFSSKAKFANYTYIEPKRVHMDIVLSDLRKENRFINWICLHSMAQKFVITLAEHGELESIVNSKDTKFDLVFIELYHGDGLLSLGYRFNCPVIGLSFQQLLPQYHWLMKNPITFSYIPHLFSPYKDVMNFWERWINSVFGIFTILFNHFVSVPWQQKQINSILRSANITKIPLFKETRQYLSLALVESHFTAGYVKPSVPTIVDVAGIHINTTRNELPQDLQNFINDAKDGFIYVSLGTLIEPEFVNEIGLNLMEVFRNISHKIIWKWNKTIIGDVSNNVMIQQWLPQIDILNHPKCKLFISHGGYHSLLETIYSGVPIVAMPFFTDQYYNGGIIEKFSIGKITSTKSTTAELHKIITEVLANDEYRKNVRHQSKLFRDRPMSPMDTAVYWVEYVLRYKGAPHLKSSATKLYWFEYLLLDVILASIVTVYVLIYFVKKLINTCYTYLRKIVVRLRKQELKNVEKCKKN